MEPLPPGRSPPTAWQPFTFGGVAAFASASGVRLLALLLVTGLFLGWGVVSYLRTACYPAVEGAVLRLPPDGGIRRGVLFWPTNSVVELGNTRLVSLVVNPESAPVPGQAADVRFELTARALTAQSLFGYWVLPYPLSAQVPLNRAEIEPLWAAWRPHVQVVLPAGVVLALLLFWIVLALLVAPGLRLLAALGRREVTLGGCWRLALAALMPAACGTAFGLLLYSSRGFHLLDTLITWLLAHLYTVVLWCGALFCLPPKPPRSPFVPEPTPPEATGDLDDKALEPWRAAAPRSPFTAPASLPPDPRNPFAGPGSATADAQAPPPPAPPDPPPAPAPAPRASAPPPVDAEVADEDPLNPS
jgi:hypothetical protein